MSPQFSKVLLLAALSTSACLWAQTKRDVILAARRTPVAEVIDASTLDTIARLHFDFQVEKLKPGADVRELFIDGYKQRQRLLPALRTRLGFDEAERKEYSRLPDRTSSVSGRTLALRPRKFPWTFSYHR